MVKAHIKTKEGTIIEIEGNPIEVANLIARIKGEAQQASTKSKIVSSAKFEKSRNKQKNTPTNLIASLIDGDFFKRPKELAAIKIALEEQGHFYPITTLSPAVLRLVRKRELRRIKDNQKWTYVKG